MGRVIDLEGHEDRETFFSSFDGGIDLISIGDEISFIFHGGVFEEVGEFGVGEEVLGANARIGTSEGDDEFVN